MGNFSKNVSFHSLLTLHSLLVKCFTLYRKDPKTTKSVHNFLNDYYGYFREESRYLQSYRAENVDLSEGHIPYLISACVSIFRVVTPHTVCVC